MKATDFPPIQETFPEVFIIESLTIQDERSKRQEGKVLADVLKMCGKQPEYFYFRTEQELVELSKEFRRSGYRFLHLSCHGSSTEIATTYDSITYGRFGQIFAGHLQNRRLFVSACEVGNELFSTAVSATNKGMYSIASPCTTIPFDKSVALWSALYVQLFSENNDFVKAKNIERAPSSLCHLFDIPFMFSQYRSEKDAWEHQYLAGRNGNATTAKLKSYSSSDDISLYLTSELKSENPE